MARAVTSFQHIGEEGISVAFDQSSCNLEFMLHGDVIYKMVKVINLQDFLDALGIDEKYLHKAQKEQARQLEAKGSFDGGE